MKTKHLKPYYTFILLCLIATSSFAQWQNLGNTGHFTKMYDNQFGMRAVSKYIFPGSSSQYQEFIILRTYDDWLTQDTVRFNPGGGDCCNLEDFHFYNNNNGVVLYSDNNSNASDQAELLQNGNWSNHPLSLDNYNSSYNFGIAGEHCSSLFLDSSFIARFDHILKRFNYKNASVDTLYIFNANQSIVDINMSKDGYLYVLTSQFFIPHFNYLYLSRDTGRTFTPIYSSQTSFLLNEFNYVTFSDSLNGYLSTISGDVHHTNNGGQTWIHQSTPMARIESMEVKNDSTLIVGGQLGAIAVSEDFGSNWRVDTISGASHIVNIFMVDSSNVYMLDYGGNLFKKTIITGVSKNLIESKKIHLFPNPAQNQLHFNLKNAQEFQYQVLDLNGRVVQEGRLESNTLNISTLERGIFFLLLRNAEEVFSSKFVKQ